MNKPEKRILEKGSVNLQYDKGFNHCYGEWERFLPSADDIEEIIDDVYDVDNRIPNWSIIAKAISDRISGVE